MQGKKQLHPKMLYTITLEQLVPQDNFYRRLRKEIDLNWPYANAEGSFYCGICSTKISFPALS